MPISKLPKIWNKYHISGGKNTLDFLTHEDLKGNNNNKLKKHTNKHMNK